MSSANSGLISWFPIKPITKPFPTAEEIKIFCKRKHSISIMPIIICLTATYRAFAHHTGISPYNLTLRNYSNALTNYTN